MRRLRVVGLALVPSFTIAFAAACGSFDEADTPSSPAPDAGGSDANGSDAPAIDDAPSASDASDGGDDGPLVMRFCERKIGASVTFCEDFEQDPFGKKWSGRGQKNNATGLLGLTGVLDRSLEVKIPSSDSVDVQDFLFFDPIVPTSATVIGFTLNANGAHATDDVELLQLYEFDPTTNRELGIKIENGSLKLFADSKTPTFSSSMTFGAMPTTRARITIAMNGTKLTATRDDSAEKAEIAIDGGAASFATAARLAVGVVFTNTAVSGKVIIDDILVEN